MTAIKPFKKTSILASATVSMSLSAALCALPSTASAQDVGAFMGEIRFIAGNTLPQGWEFCDGQLLQINSNTALFSLIGPFYGGDQRTTLALPDMRGRALIHQGQGPGLPSVRLGDTTDVSNSIQGGTQVSSSPPSLAMRCIIAVEGLYPSRS